MANIRRKYVSSCCRRPRIRASRPKARSHAHHRTPAREGRRARGAHDAAALDAVLHGGLPRGELSEVAGARSSGRTTLLLQVMAAATRRGEIAALVDTFDRLDLASVVAAGIDLDRLLWIRGEASSPPDRAIERALKALNLVLQSGGFGVAAIDLADAPLSALNRLPFTTWMRVQRTIEGSETACLIVGPHPIARSAGGVTLSLGGAQPHGRATRIAAVALPASMSRCASCRRGGGSRGGNGRRNASSDARDRRGT